MANNNDILTKDVDAIRRMQQASVTGADDNEANASFDVFLRYAKAGQLAPAWWSYRRDEYLSAFSKQTDLFISAVYKFSSKMVSVTPTVEPRDPNVASHRRLADIYQSILIEGSEFGQGWGALFQKGLLDYCTQDNGMFWEILGDGKKDGPIKGIPLGIRSLDSLRCKRTGNVEYPVVYYHTDGKRYKLHWSRVVYLSSMPSNIATMNGVGFCWLSRAIDYAQHLLDISTYEQEKLGSRPIRQLLIGRGITGKQVAQAFQMTELQMDSQGLNNFSRNVVLGHPTNTELDVLIKDLISVPDGFDKQASMELSMYAIALAGGIAPRDLWPATTVGATRADAMFQHVGGSAGYQMVLDQVSVALGGPQSVSRHNFGKFLPSSLKLTFDFVDDDQDERSAKISKTRSETREKDLTVTGVIDTRTARQQMVEDKELSEAQFNRLELKDGRLPNGHTVDSLFLSSDLDIRAMLDLSVPGPLNIQMNSDNADFVIERIDQRLMEAKDIAINSGIASKQQTALQVIAALEWLRDIYEPFTIDSMPSENGELEEGIMAVEAETEEKGKTFVPPKSAQNNAKKVLRWREEHPDEIRGMTRVGWTRANQLAKREPLSLDTVRRMASFNRHRQNAKVDPKFKNEPWKDAGYVAWLGWGGDTGINWAMRISQQEKGGRMPLSPLKGDWPTTLKGFWPMTKGVKDAPNYRRSSTNKNCANCLWGKGDKPLWCELFDFTYVSYYTCDDWTYPQQQGLVIPAINQVHFLNRELETINKQVDGEDIPPEVEEYEQEIIDLMEQANNGEITEEEFESQVEEITTAIIVLLFLRSVDEESQDDLDNEQQDRLDEELGIALAAVPGLARDVFARNYLPEEEGGKGWNTTARAVLWATFAVSVYELGKLYNKRDERGRLQWTITPGKDSCTDCLRLNGQVHTREEWLNSGWWPKSRGLACNGYNCGCSLIATNDSITGGF